MGTEQPHAVGSAPFSPTKGDPGKLPQGLSFRWLRPHREDLCAFPRVDSEGAATHSGARASPRMLAV